MAINPMESASIWSRVTFKWAKKYIADTSFFSDPPSALNPETHYQALKSEWKKQLSKTKPSFFKAVWLAFGWKMFLDAFPFALDTVCQVSIGVMIGFLIEFIQDYSGDSLYIGFLYASGISACLFTSFISKHLSFIMGHLRSGIIKQSVQHMLNNKLLKIAHSEVNKGGLSGLVINLFSMDTEQMDLMVVINFLWLALLAVVFIAIAILFVIGPVGLVGLGIISLLVPFQIRVNNYSNQLRVKIGQRGDRRVKDTTEIIEGIRVLKMYGWEEAYAKRIQEARNSEVAMNRWRVCIRSSNMSIYLVSQGLACLATFGGYLLLDQEIKPNEIFSVLSLYITAQYYLTTLFPFSFGLLSSYQGSCTRITEFLLRPETKSLHKPYKANSVGVKLKNVTAGYDEPILHEINVKFPPNELSFVIGEVGSGKSTLLLTILGEINMHGGTVYKSGKFSYIEQETWIVSGTIKENIVLGRTYDSEKLNQILECTGLSEDVRLLPQGIETLIGERGTNLSGGQKARLGLARGLYTDADIYLLDDPLSAVDVKVGRHIFEHSIQGYLHNKTRILITHQVQFISPNSNVFRVHQGLLDKISGSIDLELPEPQQSLEPEKAGEGAGKENVDENEAIESNWYTLPQYLWRGWKCTVPAFGLLYPATAIVFVTIPFWLAYWSEQDDMNSNMGYYLEVLGFIVLILFALGFLMNNLMSQSLQTSSNNLHNSAIHSLSRFPMLYFDKNTTGKIMGRLSNDIFKMDELIPWMTPEFLQIGFLVLGSITAILIGNWFMIIFIIPLVLGLYFIFKKTYKPGEYHYTMYNASKGPIYNHISITASGIFAIRAFGLVKDFKSMFKDVVGYSYNRFFAYHASSRFMHFYNDFLAVTFLAVNIFLAVALVEVFDRVLLATGLSLLLIVSIQLVFTIFLLSQNKTFMVSAVRMMNYIKEPREAELVTESHLEITNGRIEFRDAVLAYGNNPPALRNLNLTIQGGEKVGIVGRTGAGKSTIIMSLFRMVELTQGQILIDRTDIRSLGLHTLRKQISVIPQTPFIFSASLRYNLDPFQEHSDDDLWRVLALSSLEEKANSLPEKLSSEISSSILSVGQKQLLCLARALLRNSRILVMDEATANVDNETDKKIQTAINTHFAKSTVLIIAHRLNTIIKCRKIVVMSEGKAQEIGSPKELLDQPDSYFRNMVMATGEHAQDLIDQAQDPDNEN